jgi:predicted RNA-binding Zn-ribbon protein involved in translation (DUF1610 family)
MSDQEKGQSPLICHKCGIHLTPGKVTFAYLGSKFPVDMLRCPQCGLVFVPEDLARGKMQQVEKSVESK